MRATSRAEGVSPLAMETPGTRKKPAATAAMKGERSEDPVKWHLLQCACSRPAPPRATGVNMPPIHGRGKDAGLVLQGVEETAILPAPRGSSMTLLRDQAPAKINLTLSILAKRADDYHELSSLVAFAAIGDTLALKVEPSLDLIVDGPTAEGAGKRSDNLVLRAARAAQERIERLKIGRFALIKRLPAGAGLGGGSSDAAAALRLIARANDLPVHDKRLFDAALAVGADVPVCLDPKARLMHGIGEILSGPIALPTLDAVLVFPGVAVATQDVFSHFTLVAGPRRKTRHAETEIPREREALLSYLAGEANDLELAARLVAPEIGEAKDLLAETNARLVRMTGSGSAVFALYDNASLAKRAAAKVAKRRPGWWVAQTTLR